MKEVTYKIYDEKMFGPNQERGVGKQDWREPDYVLSLDGYRVYMKGEAGAQQWFLMNNDTNHTIDLGSPPLGFFKKAYDEQRVIYGVIILRDESRHN